MQHLEVSSSDSDNNSRSLPAYTTFTSIETECPQEKIDTVASRNDISDNPDYYESPASEVEEISAWMNMCSSQRWKFIDFTATAVVIFLVWMAMALPTGCYVHFTLNLPKVCWKLNN